MIRISNIQEKNEEVKEDFIFSNIRVVRNIKDYSFEENISQDKKVKLENEIIEYINEFKEKSSVYDTTNLTENEKKYFIDNCFEKEDFFNKKNAKFIFFNKNNIIILLNNKEHIKISITSSELSLKEKYDEISKIDNKIGKKFHYSVSPKYGFLTQEIKNCGLAMKISVLIHLPGLFLQGEENETFKDLEKKGYTVSKWITASNSGYFYVISSRLNFGVSEDKLIERFILGIKSLQDIDKNILIDYYNNNKANLDDIIFRSFGLLKFAQKMDQNEALTHISNLMIGIEMGLDLAISKDTLNNLVKEVLDGNIMVMAEKEKSALNVCRANFIKKYLSNGENYV